MELMHVSDYNAEIHLNSQLQNDRPLGNIDSIPSLFETSYLDILYLEKLEGLTLQVGVI